MGQWVGAEVGVDQHPFTVLLHVDTGGLRPRRLHLPILVLLEPEEVVAKDGGVTVDRTLGLSTSSTIRFPASDQPAPHEVRHRAARHHHVVVEHAHVDERQGVGQAPRDELVRLAGLGDARRMVVRQHERRGVELERPPHDLARVHRRASQ